MFAKYVVRLTEICEKDNLILITCNYLPAIYYNLL